MKDVKSNLEWKLWGQKDPLWAVAAWQGKRKEDEAPWTDESFYALGESDWKDIRRHWEHYGLSSESVVEIGCGAGRLTRQLAQEFGVVLAIDVAEGMIDYAKSRIDNASVRFELVTRAAIPAPDASFTAAFSTHVFQHLDSADDVADYFREIARVLAPGGTAMIHLPVFAWPYGAGKWVRRAFRLEKWIENRRATRERKGLEQGEPVGLMRMHSYEINYLYRLLPEFGLSDVEITVFAMQSNNDPHPFVLCRKG